MVSTAALLTFVSACTVLAITPGPGILYVLSRTLAGGRREGIFSSLGTLVGGFVHVAAAGLGVSVILATSAVAYQAVRWAGVAYLVYLGIRMIRSSSQDEAAEEEAPSVGNPLLQGIVTEMLNPKTALFFLSFIPQFVDTRAGSVFPQFLLLGTISVLLNTMADILVVWFAASLGRTLLASRRARQRQRKATGAAMIGIGAYVAVREA